MPYELQKKGFLDRAWKTIACHRGCKRKTCEQRADLYTALTPLDMNYRCKRA